MNQTPENQEWIETIEQLRRREEGEAQLQMLRAETTLTKLREAIRQMRQEAEAHRYNACVHQAKGQSAQADELRRQEQFLRLRRAGLIGKLAAVKQRYEEACLGYWQSHNRRASREPGISIYTTPGIAPLAVESHQL